MEKITEYIKKIAQNKQAVLISSVLVIGILLAVGVIYFSDKKAATEKQPVGYNGTQTEKTPLLREDSYSITSENAPYFIAASFSPIRYEDGETQTVKLEIENESPVEKVIVTMIRDGKEDEHELELVEGIDKKGTWQGSWTIEGSYDVNYQAKLEAWSSAGEYSKVVITFR